MRAFAFSLIVFVACAACGCGTIHNIEGAGPPNVIYGGVRDDSKFAWNCLHPDDFKLAADGSGEALLAIYCGLLVTFVDLPLSVIGDTLTLPVTIPATIAKGSNSSTLTEVEPKESPQLQDAIIPASN
jgi:uncharacterized protein YceK